MGSNEDCASVLDAFIHDVANLPLEINHMMEEIQAKDKEMAKHSSVIATKDGSIQKHVKLSGSMNPHPKEAEYSQTILKNLDLCEELQDQKIALSDKACTLLDRQIKRLDVKIKELQNEGLLSNDPPIPSLFNRKSQHPDSGRNFFANLLPTTENTPLQLTSGNIIHPTGMTQRMLQQQIAAPGRVASVSAQVQARGSGSSTPASAAQHLQQRHRESSTGSTDAKRRRLNANISNMPAQSSNLRQSSLGPGTPKAGTPTSGTARAGSAGPRSGVGATKKSALPGKTIKAAPHQQISKLKGKPTKRSSSVGSAAKALKKRAGAAGRNSPSVRGSGANDADDDSILSSADVSDADSHTTRRSRQRAQPTNTSTTKPDSQDPVTADGTTPTPHRKEPKSQPTTDVDMASAPGTPASSAPASSPVPTTSSAAASDASASEEEEEEEEEEEPEDTREYCFCHRVSYGDMVGCENKDCPYEWFHLDCVGLKKAPGEKDTWYCSECEAKGFRSVLHGNVR